MIKKWRSIKITEFFCEEHGWTRNVFQCADCKKYFCKKCEAPYHREGTKKGVCVECFTNEEEVKKTPR